MNSILKVFTHSIFEYVKKSGLLNRYNTQWYGHTKFQLKLITYIFKPREFSKQRKAKLAQQSYFENT